MHQSAHPTVNKYLKKKKAKAIPKDIIEFNKKAKQYNETSK